MKTAMILRWRILMRKIALSLEGIEVVTVLKQGQDEHFPCPVNW